MNSNRVRTIWGSVFLATIFAFGTTAPAEAGNLWPFASKKNIKQLIDPLSGRVTELEEVNRQQGARIKEIDERTQKALRETLSKTEEADSKAMGADRKATEAGTAANKAYASVGETENRLSNRLQNVENYQPMKTVQVNFKPGQTKIDENARTALDELAAGLKESKGYLLEIEGFADPSGSNQSNLELSRQRASSVVRYLSEKHEIPLFRMRTIGMGVEKMMASQSPQDKKMSRRVDIHVLRNDVKEMASK